MINANHNALFWLRLYHASMHYDLYSNHNVRYRYVFHYLASFLKILYGNIGLLCLGQPILT